MIAIPINVHIQIYHTYLLIDRTKRLALGLVDWAVVVDNSIKVADMDDAVSVSPGHKPCRRITGSKQRWWAESAGGVTRRRSAQREGVEVLVGF